jgi:predicted Rossmann-fold nucleotide-binding protein
MVKDKLNDSQIKTVTMSSNAVPFVPLRWSVYDYRELFQEFDSANADSYAATRDFAIYRYFVMEGRSAPQNPFTSMMEALHDNSITQATQNILAGQKVAAVMGGHKLARNSKQYTDIARLSRRLTRAGILLCTGGGPGAMEATHLGAALAPSADSELDAAVKELSAVPTVPALSDIVARDGTVDQSLVVQSHAWFKPAFEIVKRLSNLGSSLAIPTWHYGHEPTTPFATSIAKYFQNSIREDGLLAIATQGIIFTKGKAGTIQEIFQDATQNYYKTFSHFSPMVLLGSKYWTQDYPVVAVLEKLFTAADYGKYVLVTDDIDEAASFIEEFVP